MASPGTQAARLEIKSGGYKLSALEIEEVLRQHPHIQECAVVGIEDETWGEAVAAAVKTRDDFPRNAMGKVMKPALKRLFRPD